ncbi:uncharacterized protein K489DRAFT_179819 [Dissoconium aciculare CBS 342.82]|uniref:Uncharacterized protein n=1 Tax=Dissoconium aciculare CBS 342.82 TaxID=1314786 RepID=A0A6J3M8K0_9PEZI|nr:uncharacterized protein K489DRAFT_179819 [Dissoconium aciculare CBS 342.82]KAF1824320.1 hypothetical protein K489DRAFT_179819 [Dissoconium aciculare CBS 342.82]
MAQPQAYQQVAITTQTGKGALEPMSILLNDSFRDDPAMRYGLGALSEAEQEAYRQQFLRVLFKAAALNGGSFHFARDDKSCGGIWVPPGKKVDNPLTVFPSGFLGVIRKLGLKGSSTQAAKIPFFL